MKYNKLIVIFVLSFFVWQGNSFAQHSKKAERAFQEAQEAFYQRDYMSALKQLDKAISVEPDFADAWMMKGEIGMETRQPEMAIVAYERALSIDSMLFPPMAITLSRLYDEKMDYASETRLLSWFQRKAGGKNADNDATATRMLELARFRQSAVSHPVRFNPENLGVNVNTSNDEYVNMLQLDGTQLLFTRRMKGGDNERMDESLYVSHSDTDQWQMAEKFGLEWDYNDNMGAAFVSADGQTLYFTACGLERGMRCDIYTAELASSSSWINPHSLGETVNSSSWDSQPCVSADGKELYFVSRRSGNADIYCCKRNADGTWSAPENMGNVINTKGTEMAPFLHPDGNTLYFASDMHVGMGGYDLFMSRRTPDGQWQTPVNLGYPINTPDDEINFFVAADGKTAFISSFREGGHGGYDIYSFELEAAFRPEAVTYIKANVFDKTTREPIPASARFFDPVDGSQLYAFESADGSLFAVLPARNAYSLEVSSPGYLFRQQHVAPSANSELHPFAVDLFLDKLEVGSVVSLQNILFEFNSSELRAGSYAGIVMLVDFLKKNPNMSVELAGHTDNVGDAAYNKKLSSDRAEVVKTTLINNGIEAARLTAKGYGAIQPLVANDSDENRAINRRTEMVVTQMK